MIPVKDSTEYVRASPLLPVSKKEARLARGCFSHVLVGCGNVGL